MQHNKQIVAAAQFTSGPLPSADQLIKYNQAHPQAAERIIKMAEEQAAHRRSLETSVVKGDSLRASFGLFCAFVLALGALAASVYLIILGHEFAGGVIFGGTLVSIVSSFIYGTKVRRQDRPKS